MDIQLKIVVTMTAIAVLITLVISLNFTILYLYILDKRKRQMGIFLVCGLNRGRQGIYVWECICCHYRHFVWECCFSYYYSSVSLSGLSLFGWNIYKQDLFLIFAVYCLVSFTVLSAAVAGHILKRAGKVLFIRGWKERNDYKNGA